MRPQCDRLKGDTAIKRPHRNRLSSTGSSRDREHRAWLYLVVLFTAVGASVALAVRLAERRIEVSPILVLREESR